MSDFRISENPEDDVPRRSKHIDRKGKDIEKDARDAVERLERPKSGDSLDKFREYGKSRAATYADTLEKGYGKIPSSYKENYRAKAAKELEKKSDSSDE
jgi:hypothetical protein